LRKSDFLGLELLGVREWRRRRGGEEGGLFVELDGPHSVFEVLGEVVGLIGVHVFTQTCELVGIDVFLGVVSRVVLDGAAVRTVFNTPVRIHRIKYIGQ
jgi:hypothetical protein